jgi:hypothetical protein
VLGFVLGTFQGAREGRFADVDPLLGELLGRKPRTVRDLLAESAANGTLIKDSAGTGQQLMPTAARGSGRPDRCSR